MHVLKKDYEEIKAEILFFEERDLLTLSDQIGWTPWY